MSTPAQHTPVPSDRLPDASPAGGPPPIGGVPARSVERLAALDHLLPALRGFSAPFANPPLGAILRGERLGHALHPTMTDLPIGFWTSAVVLDVCGGAGSRDAARRLLALGVLSAVPTAWTGWAEWHRLPQPESRVGTLHALLGGAAIGLFAESWVSRRSGRHVAGVGYAMAGSAIATAAGYLGGHLTGVRKAGYRDPAYDQDGVGPALVRPSH